MRRHGRALATLLGVLALVLATTQIAQAAAITFLTPRASFVATTAARCTSAVIPATPATGTGVQRSAVVLDAVPASCAGVAGRLLLATSSGAPVATAVTFTIPAAFAGGSVTVPYGTTGSPATFDASQVASAVLTLGTWRVSTSWSFTAPPVGPIEPTSPGVTVTSHAWTPNAGTSFCVTFTITNTTASPVPWVLDVDLAQAPFNVPAGQTVWTNDYNLTSGTTQLQPVVQGTTTSQPVAAPAPYAVTSGHLLLQAAGWQSTRVLAAGQATTATICDYSAPSPAVVAAGPTTYSVVSSPSVVSNQLCVTTTVTGLTTATSTGLVPFVGWQATVDWAAAVNSAASGGLITPAQRTQLLTRTLTTWSNTAPSSRNGSYSGTQLTATTYQLVGTDSYNTASIAGGMQLSARSCVALP